MGVGGLGGSPCGRCGRRFPRPSSFLGARLLTVGGGRTGSVPVAVCFGSADVGFASCFGFGFGFGSLCGWGVDGFDFSV